MLSGATRKYSGRNTAEGCAMYSVEIHARVVASGSNDRRQPWRLQDTRSKLSEDYFNFI